MNEFELSMTRFWTDKSSSTLSFFRLPEESKNISTEHKDQIHFLNEEGTKFIWEYIKSSKMLSETDITRYDGLSWQPFYKEYFQSIERLTIRENCDKQIKKWLYNREIPFSKYVFIDSANGGQALMLTWKMVIKYWQELFWAHDTIIVDSSLDWGLFYFHESELYFGKDLKFDREKEGQQTMELNKAIQEWQSKMKSANK